jgi:hypothetical protein
MYQHIFNYLGLFAVFSIGLFALTVTSQNVYAQEINVESFSLEGTTIITVDNNSDKNINSFKTWLGADSKFKSFKTENGWTGELNAAGVIVFTSADSIKPGESVKFGVTTDKSKLGINWKTLDKSGEQLDTGKVVPKDLKDVVQNTPPKKENNTTSQDDKNTGPNISTESTFRIVPEKPNVGSTIRVTGDKFGSSQEFDFYIDTKKIGTFVTDKDGHFITTMKIPENQKADRVDLKVKDNDGEEKVISLRIGNLENITSVPKNIKLTIKGLPNIIHRGDFLEIYGTGNPGNAITAKIISPDGNIINSRTLKIDNKGNWKLDEPIIVALDSPFGKYSATISDGREELSQNWSIESNKVILLAPTSLKFEKGETMKFNGTALPNKSIEVKLEDPLGKEVFSDIIQVGDTGLVEFEYLTNHNSLKGTYTLIATQEKEKEFSFVGLAQLPSIPVNLEFDKLNYKTSETVEITIVGRGSEIISLLIIDPSDKPKGNTITIKLPPDGRGEHSLDLDGYSTGVYTVIASKGNTKSSEIFAVGLQTGSGEIEINTTKIDYLPGDSILILGNTGDENSLLIITLTDPDGKKIKEVETFSDKNAKITESSFRIPTTGKPGMWEIKASSGSNFAVVEIDVLPTLIDGMVVVVNEGSDIIGYGQIFDIKVAGAQQSVEIIIVSKNGEILDTISSTASSQGAISYPWIVPRDTVPGIYTVNATDTFTSAVTTFEIK